MTDFLQRIRELSNSTTQKNSSKPTISIKELFEKYKTNNSKPLNSQSEVLKKIQSNLKSFEENKIRTIPNYIETEEAFSKNEQGYWEGKLYISLIDDNLWTPTEYPAGWQIVE